MVVPRLADVDWGKVWLQKVASTPVETMLRVAESVWTPLKRSLACSERLWRTCIGVSQALNGIRMNRYFGDNLRWLRKTKEFPKPASISFISIRRSIRTAQLGSQRSV